MLASRRPTRQRSSTLGRGASAPGRAAPGGARFSLRSVLRKSRRKGGAQRGGEDSDEEAEGLESPGRTRDEGRVRGLAAAECTDRLFHLVKLRLLCPGRWSRLFLAAAKRLEARLDRLREAAHVAAALDDAESLARLRDEVPPALWKWWAYDLGLTKRAGDRCRPEQLRVLPALFGEAYPGLKAVTAKRAALDARPAEGSPQAVQERQRGEALIQPLRRALEAGGEIDLAAVDEVLSHALAGPWRTSDVPACGVNYGAASVDYAGWRPLHFAAAAVRARATAVPAIRRLVAARADATCADDGGGTALHLAAGQGHMPAVEALLEAGTPVEAADRNGVTALLAAARVRQAAVVRRLAAYAFPADAHAEVLRAEGEKQAQRFSLAASTELHVQVAKGDLGKIRQLVVDGDGNGNELADVNFPDSLGRRAAHTAVHQVSNDDRAADVVRALAAYRADLDAKDSEGQTALHAAVALQRVALVRALLRLRVHACLPDGEGRTPLMLAAAPADESRERPAYDGVPVSRPVAWSAVQELLEWDGRGDPPGPPPRRTTAPQELVSEPAWTFKPKRRRRRAEGEGEEEEEQEEQEEEAAAGEDAGRPPDYFTESDAVRARAEALGSLGFDDQRIVDAEGRINRGDRVQLFQALFRRQGQQGGPGRPALQPDEKRLRLLWSKLTGPLVRLDLQGGLPPRAAEVLQYLLLTMLGRRGAVFALLVAANSGIRNVSLPTWADFTAVLASSKKLAGRAEAVFDFAFRGPMPKRTLWVGAVWSRDEYPREPDSVPWEGLVYVSKDNAPKLNERNEELSYEAFRDNVLPVFEEPPSEEAPLAQHRYERLQLANRLFVDEALGARMFPWERVPLLLRAEAEERMRVAGLRLLCPLLEEAAYGLRGGATRQAAAAHRDLLRYVAVAMAEPGCTPEQTPEVLRQPFWAAWQRARGSARAALADNVGPQLGALTKKAELALEGGGERAAPSQAAMLLPEQVRPVRRRHSADAFFALRRCGAVESADDFDELLINLVAMAPTSFGERFWYLALNLLLWGHAGELLPFFETELRKRLPEEEGLELRGPRLLPRGDVLLAASRDADGTGRRGGSGTRPLPAFSHAGAVQTEGPTFVASPAVLPHRIGFVWRSTPPEALVLEDVEDRCWAKEVGFLPGDEVVELNGRRPCEMSPEEFALTITNRPVRFKLRLREAQAEALPVGRTDILRAEVLCADEEALASAFRGLCGGPGEPAAEAAAAAAERGPLGAPAVEFRVVHASNDFHKSRREEIFPRAASVLLTARLAVRFPGPEARLVQQLVEVELLLAFTADARWLADFLNLDPRGEMGPMRVRSPGQPSGLGPVRKRSVY